MNSKRICGTAYAQSETEGHEAARAIDGRKDTCWIAEPYYQWWMLDCGKTYCLEEIVLQPLNRGRESYRYAVDCSTDRINWRELFEKTDDSASNAEGDRYRVSATARYIRITMTYCSEGEQVGLANVEITGSSAEPEEERRRDLFRGRVRAVECSASTGFTVCGAELPETGWKDDVLRCDGAAGLFRFDGVELGNLRGQQLKGFFRLPETDRDLHVIMTVRTDSPDGMVIGRMDMHRQYTSWVQFACDLEDGEYGTRDLYFCIERMDAPQSLEILWLAIMPKPVLDRNVIDHADEVPDGEGEYKAYLGDAHSHTGFSDGVHTPPYAYDYARYTAGLDFLGITEHSNLFDDTFDANVSRKWRDIKHFAEEKTENGSFLALMGSETTWYNQFGHMNIYGADFFLNPYELRYNDTSRYYERLKEFPMVINQWNHPWCSGDRHLDMFEPYDPELDKVMYTMEIRTVEPVKDSLPYYIHALDLGWHISPVGNQDNHRENWGTENDMRTGVVIRHLTKADYYDAIRRHRTYYTNAKHMRVVARVNGELMGATLSRTDVCRFSVDIRNEGDDAVLSKIEGIGEHGAVLFTERICGHTVRTEFCAKVTGRYCFLKIWQEDGNLAATAPVWFE